MTTRSKWMALGGLVALAVGSARAGAFTWVPVSGVSDWNTPANWRQLRLLRVMKGTAILVY